MKTLRLTPLLSCLATAAVAQPVTLDVAPRRAEILQPVTVTTNPVTLSGAQQLKIAFGDSTTADTYIGDKNSQSLKPKCPLDGDIRKTACTYSVAHRYKKPGTYSLTLYRIALSKEGLTGSAGHEILATSLITISAP